MLRLHDISIRNKLILMQVLTSIVVLGVVFTAFIINDIRSYKLRKEKTMLGIVQLMARNASSTLEFDRDDEAQDMLNELKTVAPEIVHATIKDSSGKIFAAYSRQPADTFNIPADLSSEKSMFRKDRLFVSEDILVEGKIVGRVFIETDLAELRTIKRNKIELALILLLVAIGVAFAFALTVQTYTSGRLITLINTMKEVGKTGDYNRSIADKGKDEISELIGVFNNLMQQVKMSQQRKDEFIGIASHELKTPLTSIKGYAELLNQVEDRQPQKKYAEKTLASVEKMERLIHDLLDVSKIQSGQLELSMMDFNIDKLLDDTIASVQMVSPAHQITRQDSLNNEIIAGDQQRIEQVITNLLSNAIKYSPGQTKIVVSGKKTDKELIIKVRDYGIGVSKGEQASIFERFYRTRDNAFTITGFGLGLYICKDIIRRHNGRIWVEQEDKGSSFYFSLPLKQVVTV